MRAYSARHITRLASYSGAVTNGDNLMELIDFDPDFTNPKIFKIQIAVENDCEVEINGNSKVVISSTYGLTLDYTDLMIDSFVFKADVPNVYVVVGY